MRMLNLGILAHVDAGKTSLTERLLYAAGVIDAIGSVDAGTTQTDALDLERQRGITIKAAVVSFVLDDLTVNLIDTPGHPDFIAEVERALGVLDGAVLVISAVEGVQAQTRVLMRALQRLRIPALLFVNKIDRTGADPNRVLAEIAARLTPSVVAMGSVRDAGTRGASFVPFRTGDADAAAMLADVLSRHDDDLLADYIQGEPGLPSVRVRLALAAQTGKALVHPVFFGSAITGAGMNAFASGLTELLPVADHAAEGPVSGTIFKVERGPASERIAYVRMFSGAVHVRERVAVGGRSGQRVTAIRVFEGGKDVACVSVAAGQIAKLWGFDDVRIGDAIGVPRSAAQHHFAPPTLETVIEPARPADRGNLRLALDQLAEQDPLINLRQDDMRQETYVSLYGEVQKEVIQETLASSFGIAVDFRETTAICVERPLGTGHAVEFQRVAPNPFLATIGLRVEPGPIGSGIDYRRASEVLGTMPLAYFTAIEDTVRSTLQQGLRGWQVTDCVVTMTHSGYSPRQSHAHQGFSKAMSSTGADFRGLTPLVLMQALKQAGTAVFEPVHRFRLEIPSDTFGAIAPVLARQRAIAEAQEAIGASLVLHGAIPAAEVHQLQRDLPALTRGEGVLESAFEGYQPAAGATPTRSRTDNNPLDRKEYLLHVLRRA